MKTKGLSTVVFMLVSFLACVTVNIYFPAVEAQKTAEEIVKDIRGKSTLPKKKPKKTKPESWHLKPEPAQISRIGRLFITSAYAQEGALEVSNTTIRALKASMKKRYPSLMSFLQKGNLGENNKGFIAVRSWQGLNLRQRAQLKRLLEAENQDRRRLYQEVAKALQIDPSQIEKLQKIFAKEWQKTAPQGTWIQKENGRWVRK